MDVVINRKSFATVGLSILVLFNSGCQIGYLTKSAYNQIDLLASRKNIEDVLADTNTKAEVKAKLLLSKKAMQFAVTELGLIKSKNYQTYVELGRPYVTWVVSAAEKWQLQHHDFHYPIVGRMPYKGYFNESDAKEFQAELDAENLDTYLRGVSAYSTLGWFNDPILSSMIRYQDFDFVDTIIHETVHATLYIKNNADFNERLAVFLGGKGAEAFFKKEEGANSPTIKQIEMARADDRMFSDFISKELRLIEDWYKNNQSRSEESRQERFKEIQLRFKENILPNMQTKNYAKFVEIKLNNARLLNYRTYFQDQSVFDRAYEKLNHNFKDFIAKMKSFEGDDNPEQALKKFAEN